MSNFIIDSYRFAAVETCQTITGSLDPIGIGGGGDNITQVGVKLLDGSPFIGMNPTEIKFRILHTGTARTGNITMKIYDAGQSLVDTSDDTIDAATVTDSYTQQTWSFDGSTTLAEDYIIAISGSNANDSNRINVKISATQEFASQKAVFEESSEWLLRTRTTDVCMK